VTLHVSKLVPLQVHTFQPRRLQSSFGSHNRALSLLSIMYVNDYAGTELHPETDRQFTIGATSCKSTLYNPPKLHSFMSLIAPLLKMGDAT